MFVPAHNTKLMDNACKIAADVLLPDIEDSVQPAENKQVARDNILRYVSEGRLAGKVLYPIKSNNPKYQQLLRVPLQHSLRLFSLDHGIIRASFLFRVSTLLEWLKDSSE